MNGNKLSDGNWQFLDDHNSAAAKGYIESGAIFNQKDWRNARYRYTLWRTWDSNLPRISFVMLNCSKGNHFELTPTSEYCDDIARNGLLIKGERVLFGSVEVVNLFAFRSPKPVDMKNEKIDVIGTNNDDYIKAALKRSKVVIVAWGEDGKYQNRDKSVLNLINIMGHKPYRIAVTSKYYPYHPYGILKNRYRLFKAGEDRLKFVERCFGEYVERPKHHP